jgi:hypothetical protein
MRRKPSSLSILLFYDVAGRQKREREEKKE